MVNYYVAYNKENSAINLSIVLYHDKEAVGIMPLIAHQNQEEEWILSSNGIEIVEPIFKKTVARKVKKRLENELMELIYDLARQLNIIGAFKFTSIILPSSFGSFSSTRPRL